MGSNLVIGFEQFTIILKIEKMIFESNTINLITSEKTLYCTLMNSDNIIQVFVKFYIDYEIIDTAC